MQSLLLMYSTVAYTVVSKTPRTKIPIIIAQSTHFSTFAPLRYRSVKPLFCAFREERENAVL